MPNTYKNKVVYNGTTLIDLTADTVTASTLMQGYTAHDKSGALITGTADKTEGSVYQDEDGYLVVDDSESTAPQGNISITANGTYDVADYAGASVSVKDAQLTKIITRAISTIEWPSDLTSVGSYAFRSCTYFNPPPMPDTVTYIGEYAFQYTKVSFTRLPSSLDTISSYCFNCCTNLTSIECEGPVQYFNSYAFTGTSTYPSQLVSASFPNAITSSLPMAFGSNTANNACKLLAFCDIGSIASIAANAFANCYALQTLVLRKSDAICTLANVSAFNNTPMSGYNSLTGTVYVPQALKSTYQTATNWSTLYNAGTVTFAAIEGSEYERD